MRNLENIPSLANRFCSRFFLSRFFPRDSVFALGILIPRILSRFSTFEIEIFSVGLETPTRSQLCSLGMNIQSACDRCLIDPVGCSWDDCNDYRIVRISTSSLNRVFNSSIKFNSNSFYCLIWKISTRIIIESPSDLFI